MQQKWQPFYSKKTDDELTRDQHLIAELGDIQHREHEPIPETLKKITTFVMTLDEPYRQQGLQAIAEHFVNHMCLHYFALLAHFLDQAVIEGVTLKDVNNTFLDILPHAYQQMVGLSERIRVQSLFDVVFVSILVQTTYDITRFTSFEDLRALLYAAPDLYSLPLEARHLLMCTEEREQSPVLSDGECMSLAQRQWLIEELGDARYHVHAISPETLQRITGFLVGLDEPYRQQGLQKIAEHFTNHICLRHLELMAIFQDGAAAEGITQDDVSDTFSDILPDEFQQIVKMSKHINVQSLFDLTYVSALTLYVHGITRFISIEDTWSSLYSLPGIYCSPLETKNLFSDDRVSSRKIC